jgi:hypothetical protein
MKLDGISVHIDCSEGAGWTLWIDESHDLKGKDMAGSPEDIPMDVN